MILQQYIHWLLGEGFPVSDALRAERVVKHQLERVRLEAEKRNLLSQMDTIKSR